ncbi:MAG: phophatidylinositol-4-phosphate 5-kinase [Flaviaesturariibacter sp.]|nr:phophatidylinositol-4-phosphate 5-kinase [Flaviaesturariibacter sp.]
MRNTFVCLALLFCAGTTAIAQSPAVFNSGMVLSEAIKLHDKEEYKKAVTLFKSIPRNDTNYVKALYEMSLSYLLDSNYTAALAACEEGLKQDPEDQELDLLISKGSILDEMGKREEALATYNAALQKYPASQGLLLNKAITLLRADIPQEAEVILQNLVLTNPYYASAHMKLANCAISQGRPIPAMLSLFSYLMISPNGRHFNSAIQLLSAISKNDDAIRELVESRKNAEETFGRAEQVILSKIALDKDYKQQTAIDDPIIRQLQALMDIIQYDESSDDFYMQYYVPVFKQIITTKRFEPLVNLGFSNVNLEAIQKYVKKNSKEIKEAANEVSVYFNQIRTTRELSYKKRLNAPALYHYDTDNTIIGKGRTNAKNDPVGTWEYYFDNGNLKARGDYSEESKKQGLWKFQYANGKQSGIENWQNDVQHGEDIIYFLNGNTMVKTLFTEGKRNGESTKYYSIGHIRSITPYKDNQENGVYREFYSSGRKYIEATMAADKNNGTYTSYYKNGKIAKTCTYKDGLLEGPYKSYHENGQLSFEATYTNDKLNGEAKNYHENGKLKETRRFVNDKLEGEDLEYNNEGVLITKVSYKDGKAQGLAYYYDADGKLYSTFLFDKDIFKEARYYDKSGKEISTSARKGKNMDLTVYSPEGFKGSFFTYNDAGQKINTGTYYYASGKVKETNEYKEGQVQGMCIGYYQNGTKEYEITYANDEKNGPATFYHLNGKIKSSGFYKDGDADGDWTNYNEKGNVTEKFTYLNGDLTGYSETYLPNGKLDLEEVYQKGWLTSLHQYDSTGKTIFSGAFKNGNGKYESIFPNGKKRYEGTYKNGEFDGPFTVYYGNGGIRVKKGFDRGLLQGNYTDYHVNGKVASTGEYELGDKKGTWKYYTAAGAIWKEETYAGGKVNGKSIFYHANGKIDREIEYKSGEIHGSYKRYSDDGFLMLTTFYTEGKINGYTYLDKSGQPVKTIHLPGGNGKIESYFASGVRSAEMQYAEGKLQGHFKLYYSTGQLYYQCDNEAGLTQGRATEYYKNGAVQSEYNYYFDNMDGSYKEYHENGKVKEEGQYYNGSENGIFNYYDATGKRTEQRKYYYGILLAITP